jgi:hypothetical protein
VEGTRVNFETDEIQQTGKQSQMVLHETIPFKTKYSRHSERKCARDKILRYRMTASTMHRM